MAAAFALPALFAFRSQHHPARLPTWQPAVSVPPIRGRSRCQIPSGKHNTEPLAVKHYAMLARIEDNNCVADAGRLWYKQSMQEWFCFSVGRGGSAGEVSLPSE